MRVPHGSEQAAAGETAFLVPPNDPAALAEALREAICLTPRQRDHLAARASDHVRRNFSKEAMCDDTLHIYRELLAEGRGRLAAARS